MNKASYKRLTESRALWAVSIIALIVIGVTTVGVSRTSSLILGTTDEHRQAVSDVNEAADTVRAELAGHMQRLGITIKDANPLCYSNKPLDGGSCYEQAYITELPMDDKLADTFAVESRRLSTDLPAAGWTAVVKNAPSDVSAHRDDAATWLRTNMLELGYMKRVNGLRCDLDLTAGKIGDGTLHGYIYCTKPVDPAGLPIFPG